eukprot:5159431-Amphidinium_carterae.1
MGTRTAQTPKTATQTMTACGHVKNDHDWYVNKQEGHKGIQSTHMHKARNMVPSDRIPQIE